MIKTGAENTAVTNIVVIIAVVLLFVGVQGAPGVVVVLAEMKKNSFQSRPRSDLSGGSSNSPEVSRNKECLLMCGTFSEKNDTAELKCYPSNLVVRSLLRSGAEDCAGWPLVHSRHAERLVLYFLYSQKHSNFVSRSRFLSPFFFLFSPPVLRLQFVEHLFNGVQPPRQGDSNLATERGDHQAMTRWS